MPGLRATAQNRLRGRARAMVGGDQETRQRKRVDDLVDAAVFGGWFL